MSDTMTLKEVGQYLGFHEMTLYRWCKVGKIPPLKKVGGRWKCSRAELDAWFFVEVSK